MDILQRPRTSPTQTVVQIGIGGYGRQYLWALQPLLPAAAGRLIGAIDPVAASASDFAALTAAGVPVWPDVAVFLASGVRPDLVIIASPIAFHCEQTCAALSAGFAVLCEKPVAATLDEVRRMRASRDAAGRLLAIGYQWSYAPPLQALKADILAGRYGAPRRFKAWVAWPRSSAYYARNGWAGRMHDRAGRPVYDSPVNNATAHHLHNLLYLLGDRPDAADAPRRIAAEIYRANPIESFDAACLRLTTARGVEVLFYTAHCVETPHEPEFRLEFDHGTVRHLAGTDGIVGTQADGAHVNYGEPGSGVVHKLASSLAAVAAGSRETLCGLEAASRMTCVVNALQPMPVHDLAGIAARREVKPGETLTFIPGLTESMQECFETGRLFSEAGIPWAHAAIAVDSPSLDA